MNQCNRFRNATVLYSVFHQDKLDASFCCRMFHPPLLAVIVLFYASVKSGISIPLVAIANLNVTPASSLNFGGTAQKEIEFSYMCWDMFPVLLASCFKSWSRKVSTDFHPHDRAMCFEMLCYLYWYCFK